MVMTRNRVRSFIDEYGTEGVYISFSGGKDSTILMDIVRKVDRRIPAVFVDTWMEYPAVCQETRKCNGAETGDAAEGNHLTIRLVLSEQGRGADHMVCEAGKAVGAP